MLKWCYCWFDCYKICAVSAMFLSLGVAVLFYLYLCCPCHDHCVCDHDKVINELNNKVVNLESRHDDLEKKLFNILTNFKQTDVELSEKINNLEHHVGMLLRHDPITKSALTYITAELSKYKDRVRMLGMLHNENWSAHQKGCSNDVLFLEQDWKIKRLPRHLALSSKDKEWLQMFLLK